MSAFRHPYVLATARIWVACFSLFIFALGIKAAFWRDAYDEYFEPDPWRPVMIGAHFALSFALAASALGVSRLWMRVLVAFPIVSGFLYWVYALLYHVRIEQFEWTFALLTGAVFGIPLVLSLLLVAEHRKREE